MPNYYNKTNPSDLRDLPQSLIDTWESVNNPKLQEWVIAPAKPSPDAVWDNGHWVIPPPPSWTAEEWLNKEGYNSTALVTLLDLNGKLIAAGKSSVNQIGLMLHTDLQRQQKKWFKFLALNKRCQYFLNLEIPRAIY